MCGRYALAKNLAEIAAYFAGEPAHPGLWTWEPNWNLSPGIVAPVIALNSKNRRAVVPMRWGLHPHWRKEMPAGRPLFNARIETAHEKPSFRTPWKRRRALVPMSGWYEWEGIEAPKTPHYIYEGSNELSAFAGLWDKWRAGEGVTLLSFTILTTTAKGPIKHLHHRMPVRLPQQYWQNWLEPDERPERIAKHICGGDNLIFHEVSRAVSSGRAQGKNLILKTVD